MVSRPLVKDFVVFNAKLAGTHTYQRSAQLLAQKRRVIEAEHRTQLYNHRKAQEMERKRRAQQKKMAQAKPAYILPVTFLE